ncbi:hypothetical protein AB8U03_15725 [Clostridium sp. Mt-5]|uniref:Uncharacterized protein n=1 Tax=Clostridium moutaii TaxID=3240932 RepID=A0ABV4BS63_9CLOT
MDIYFSDLDRTQVYQLPILPTDMPELSKSTKNEEFESYQDGVYNVIGNVELTTFPIDCWLPEYAGKYNWAKSQINPYLLINLWNNAMITKKPLKCVMSRGQNKNNISSEILNWSVTIEDMNWYPEKNGDIKYKIDCKEYRSPLILTSSQLSTLSSAVNSVSETISKLNLKLFGNSL